ncbi:TPR repeat-containing protein [Calothrix parasitica NIES-267]|uniref:TPR repeat-containing protein n=1 Tax=Calothrix parasitica NIES-267 TaxID=1973488 RepID=A0A1Z4LK69_9CYAN|nr:TPR repeat-containing protein [Calothrix parasitica NIES-267]
MKGLKALSAIVVLSFMVISPRVNAQTLPNTNIKRQTEKLQVESNPNQDKARSYFKQGLSLLRAKKYPEAIKAFSEVIRIQPNNQYGYYARGISYFRLKKYQQAKTDLDKTIELDNSIAYAYFYRGITNFMFDYNNDAITDLQTAANLFDKDGEPKQAQTCRDLIRKIRNT